MAREDRSEHEEAPTPGRRDAGVDRRSYLRLVGAAGALAAGTPAVTGADPGRSHDAKEREVLVGVADDVADPAARAREHAPAIADVVHANAKLGYATVRFPEAESAARERFLESVVNRRGVRYAEENGTAELAFAPDDPEYANQHVPQDVGAETAWDTTLGDGSVTVAVVDQGLQYDHPDLDGNVETSVTNHGRDFVDDDGDPYPDDPSSEFHGTYTAGVIAAETNNATGIAGLSDASLLSARTFDESGRGYTSDVADAIQWAADQGADVINLSLTSSEKQVLKDALSYAYEQGSLPVAAAGNDYGGAVDYPAAHEDCLAVSGYDTSSGSLLSTSNYGPEIELTAPGDDVLSTTTTDRGDYGTRSGSSVATAVVSGVAALALAEHDLTNDQLRSHLKRAAVDVGLSDDEQGAGRVDAAGAVTEAPDLVIEDFEDGDLSEYEFDRGETGASLVTSPVYEGSQALQVTGANTEMISTAGLNTYPSAGDTFSYQVRAADGVERGNVTYGVQDHQNRYYVQLDFNDGYVILWELVNGDATQLNEDFDVLPPSGEWVEVEVEWGTDGTHTVTLYDEAGTQLTQISGSSEVWTSGGIGYDGYADSFGGTLYFDYTAIDTTRGVVEGFEDGDLDEYEFDRGSSGASLVSSPTHGGSGALEYTGTDTVAISTSGLPAYPSAGDTFSCWYRASGGANNLNFTWGVQDHDNRYYVKVYADEGRMYLFTYENGQGATHDGDTTFSLSQDAWYRIEVDWATDGTQTVTLYDSGGSQLSQVSMVDSTWTDGGIGYDAYLSSGEAVYFDDVTVE